MLAPQNISAAIAHHSQAFLGGFLEHPRSGLAHIPRKEDCLRRPAPAASHCIKIEADTSLAAARCPLSTLCTPALPTLVHVHRPKCTSLVSGLLQHAASFCSRRRVFLPNSCSLHHHPLRQLCTLETEPGEKAYACVRPNITSCGALWVCDVRDGCGTDWVPSKGSGYLRGYSPGKQGRHLGLRASGGVRSVPYIARLMRLYRGRNQPVGTTEHIRIPHCIAISLGHHSCPVTGATQDQALTMSPLVTQRVIG